MKNKHTYSNVHLIASFLIGVVVTAIITTIGFGQTLQGNLSLNKINNSVSNRIDSNITKSSGKIDLTCKTASDIDNNDQTLKQSVQYTLNNNIFSLTDFPSCKFNPQTSINKAEYAKILVSGLKLPMVYGKEPVYSDINPNSWYYPYVMALAFNQGITSPTNRTFNPTSTLNQAEALKLLLSVSKYASNADFNTLLPIASDTCPNVPNFKNFWYAQYYQFAENYGIIAHGSICSPLQIITKGDIAVWLYNLSK